MATGNNPRPPHRMSGLLRHLIRQQIAFSDELTPPHLTPLLTPTTWSSNNNLIPPHLHKSSENSKNRPTEFSKFQQKKKINNLITINFNSNFIQSHVSEVSKGSHQPPAVNSNWPATSARDRTGGQSGAVVFFFPFAPTKESANHFDCFSCVVLDKGQR